MGAPGGELVGECVSSLELRRRAIAEGRVEAMSVVEPSIQSKSAIRARSRVAKATRWSSCVSGLAKKDSHMALSSASPREPIDWEIPASWRRRPKRSEVYWAP
jgi:hypothetical protein